MVPKTLHSRALRAAHATRSPQAWHERRWLIATGLGIALVWLCSQVQAQTTSVASAQSAAASEYRISRGDDLDLKFFYTPELNTKAIVRSDGRISVPLIGEVAVEGRTVSELSALIERQLAAQVNRPQVAINVQGSSALRVFVGGEVGKPGMQPLLGPLTALQAVMVAEGVKDTGQPSMALVMRRAADGTRQVIPFDLDAAMKGRSPDADLVLQPFDAVVVPRSGIADVGRWVDLYIRRTLPISFGLSYNVNGRSVTQ